MKNRILTLITTFSLIITSLPFSVYALEQSQSQSTADSAETLEMTDFDLNMEKYLGNDILPSTAGVVELQIDNSTMYIDGEKAQVDATSDTAPVIDEGRTLVPARAIVESFGGEILFDDDTREVTVNYEEKEIVFQLDSDIVKVSDENGTETQQMDVEASVQNGRTMLPILYLSENIDCEVTWVEDERVVVIENEFVTKRLLVGMKSSDTQPNVPSDVAEIFESSGGLFVLQFETSQKTAEYFENLQNDPDVQFVEIDELITSPTRKGGRTSFSEDLPTENSGGETPIDYEASGMSWGSARMGLDNMENYLASEGKNEQIIVAVLDTGVEYYHSFLNGRVYSTGYNAFDGSSDITDRHGHGTKVSGVIIDNTPSNTYVLPVKVLADNGYGTTLTSINGIKYATNQGVDIINMSLGGQGRSDSTTATIDAAVAAGVTVVIAAGNDSIDTYYFSPAHVESAIVVSAVNSNDYFSSFSNYGNSVDVSAPGEYIYTTSLGSSYTYVDGTSFSSPFVAAACALLLNDNPSLSPQSLEYLIQQNVDDVGSSGKDYYYGYGIVNLDHYLGDNEIPLPTPTPTPIPTPTPTLTPIPTPTPTPYQPFPTPTPYNPPDYSGGDLELNYYDITVNVGQSFTLIAYEPPYQGVSISISGSAGLSSSSSTSGYDQQASIHCTASGVGVSTITIGIGNKSATCIVRVV